MKARVINEESFVQFFSTCAPETFGNMSRQLGGLAMGYKIQGKHVKRTDASLFEKEDADRVYRYSLGLLKAIKWANKHGLVTYRQIKWEEDDLLGIEQLALDIYTDIVMSEEILHLLEERR